MNIGFWDNQLCERGTSLGLFNYAYYNKTLLNNNSFVFFDKNNSNNVQHIINKFKENFETNGLNKFKDIEPFIEKFNITHLFIIKWGRIDDRITTKAKCCIQCVFSCHEPHGDLYCSIHEHVKCNNGKYPVIPRIITLPNNNNNLRKQLNIPNDAIVFGGYGGKDSFSIRYVHNVVYNVAKENPNIYFLFANFHRFCKNINNIIHLPIITDRNKLVELINTSDAMLWARGAGETFGQAIAEFSIKNKPIIASKVGDLVHYHILKDKAIWYSNSENLKNILINFNPKDYENKDLNCYKEYSPEKVMNTFKELFLTI